MALRVLLPLVLLLLAALLLAALGVAPTLAFIERVATPEHLLPFAILLPVIAPFTPRRPHPDDAALGAGGA